MRAALSRYARRSLDPQAAGQQETTGEQDPGQAVMEDEAGGMVSGCREHIHRPSAQVQLGRTAGPLIQAEVGLHASKRWGNDLDRQREAGEHGVLGGLVPVAA
ncbi:hypothetical protein [Luteimonas granuli]|uniref:Uncharacterized protein n=1 Tax=Luteimonas granuli TaxID=1176533 RepID=A0A518N6Q9_9GAMM|nr:hypothetical protein [Luteimonas granuli]QDW67590.1 hypothetical protein FPZ22_12450 [Luteimonas granuli]